LSNLKFQWDRVLLCTIVFFTLFFGAVALTLGGADQTLVLTISLVSIFAATLVVIFAVLLHQAIQALHPGLYSIGAVAAIAAFICFSPFEAASIIAIINLLVGFRLIREWKRYQGMQLTVMNLRRP
jgi:hypothetical protein